MIPTPRVVRRMSVTNEDPQPIPLGNFTNAVQYVWNKFNLRSGMNLSGFRHNLRDYYDEQAPMTQYELEQVRAYLSDPALQICVSTAGDHFRWDNRPNPASRKCIYIDETMFILFQINQTDSQHNALQLIFLATLLHGLGDYITSWAQPEVDFSPNPTGPGHRLEGGTKTEYAYFGGVMGGNMADGVHYDYAKVRLFNSQNQGEHWIIPDQVARGYYAAEVITKFNEVDLRRNSQFTGPTNTIRQLDICCGTHRLVWKPQHRNPHEAQQAAYFQQPFYQPPPAQPPWYPNPQQQQPIQGNYQLYTGAAGTNAFAPGTVTQFPTPAANYGGGQFSFPPTFGIFLLSGVDFRRPANFRVSRGTYGSRSIPATLAVHSTTSTSER
jgi:hypothetical protein